MFQETQIIGLSAAVIAILCMLTRLPISWKKCEIGPTIVWIGWEFHIQAGLIVHPMIKRAKLVDLVDLLWSGKDTKEKCVFYLDNEAAKGVLIREATDAGSGAPLVQSFVVAEMRCSLEHLPVAT